MMKKIFVLFLLVFLLSSVTVYSDVGDISDKIDAEISDIDIEGFDIKEFKNQIISDGKIPEADKLFEKIIKIVFDEAYNTFKSLSSLVVPIILLGVLSNISLNKSINGVSNISYIACYVMICTSIIYIFADTVKLARETIINIDIITKCMIPALYTLMLTLGNVVSTVSMQPTVIFVSQILLVIINKFLFPLIMISFTLTITDNIANQSRLKNFSDLINKFVKWILVFMLTIFTAILSAQNILGHSFDNITLKGTKFAVTNFIPIIGGALSEGVETIGASLILIKNATGIAGIAGIAVIAFVPVIKIYAVSMMFYILSALSQPVTGERFSNVLNSAGNAAGTLGVLVICMAFVFIISVAMILGGSV